MDGLIVGRGGGVKPGGFKVGFYGMWTANGLADQTH